MTAPHKPIPESADQSQSRLWVVRWMRSEGFWRDVASQFVSGMGLLFVGIIAAVAAGYVTAPQFLQFVSSAVYWIVGFAVAIAVAIWIQRVVPVWARGIGDKSPGAIVGGAIVIGLVALYGGPILTWFSSWPSPN